jgi:hypothetical protein
MYRWVLTFVLHLSLAAPFTQAQTSGVQTVADVSFAVPSGWTYTAGADFGAMTYREGARFWLAAVYTAMPASADANADFKAAWRRTVLAQQGYRDVPSYNPYDITKTVGYAGKQYGGDSVDHTSYTRLYTLRTGKSCIPVVFISANSGMMGGMDHIENAIVGSVRQAPLKASPIRNTITVVDLAGQWKSGLALSIDYYNSSGQYTSNSITAGSWGYTIATDGTYSYKFGGMLNNRATSDEDTGVVELGGEYLTFNGKRRHERHRFVNLQTALDGSTVLVLFPDKDLAQIDSSRDVEYYTRSPKK